MSRPNIIFSTLIYSDTADPSDLFDTTGLDNLELDFEDELQNLGDMAAFQEDPTSIQAGQITWGDATNGATLTGSGLNQIQDLETLEQQLENGIASGAFDTLSFFSGGRNVLSLQFADDALTLSSGGQSLALRGALPTELQDIFDFATHMGNVLAETNLTAAATFLSDYDLEGLRLIDDGTTLFDLTLDNAGLRLNAGGGEFRVDGSLPADSIGTLVELFQDLIALDETAQGFTDLGQVADLAISSISLTAADGTELIRTTGALDEVSPLFETTIIQGTSGDDLDVYVDGYGSDSNSVVANLAAGDDSAFVFGDDSQVPVTVNGGAGFDRISVFGYGSEQTVVDFSEGTISGYEGGGALNYSLDMTGFEEVATATFQSVLILGDDAANTATPIDVFGDFYFYGDGGTDILDLTELSRYSVGEGGLYQSDLANFYANYIGGGAIELTHSDSSAFITVEEVEQVRVLGNAGGEILLTLEQALDSAETDAEFTLGTAAADQLEGDDGADILIGNAGDDFLYGDGLQANLTGDVAGQVYRMYQATLARAPDGGGYQNWVENLFEGDLTLDQMANGFVNSTEFQNTYGSLNNTGFVELLYQNVLGRAADAGGLQNWLDAMDAGTSRAGVVQGFSQAAEFQASTAQASAAFAMSQSEAVWTDEIYRVYRATLDRNPDQGGFLNWAELMGSGSELDTMIEGFVNSTEFQNTYGSLDDTGFVELLYQNVLGRAADAGGLQNWLDAMDAGTSRAGVVRGFSQASEFQSGTAEDLKEWVLDQGIHDIIEGGSGTNTLSGGLLADRFIFDLEETSTSTIMDFEAWDELVINRAAYSDFDTFSNHLSQQGDDLVFEDQDLTIVFTGVDTITEDQVFF
ncbi:MAG: DUF4214 domain-containing protein [Sulfitobacter sp.]